jgi:uncharacterized protein YjdB
MSGLTEDMIVTAVFGPEPSLSVESVEIFAPAERNPHNIGRLGNEVQQARVNPTNFVPQDVRWSLDAASYTSLISGVVGNNIQSLPPRPDRRVYEVLKLGDEGYDPEVLKIRLGAVGATGSLPAIAAGPIIEIARVDQNGKVSVLADAVVGMRFDVIATTVSSLSAAPLPNEFDTRTITVSPYVPVTGVRITASKEEMIVPETFTFVAVVDSSAPPPIGAANREVIWRSSDATIASVHPVTGVVTAIREGKVTIAAISAEMPNANTLNILTATDPRVAKVEVTVIQPKITLTPNRTAPYFPTLRPQYTATLITPLTVTVRNTGTLATGPLTITLEGGDAEAFRLNTTSLSSILPNGTNTFRVEPILGLTQGTYDAVVVVTGANGIREELPIRFIVDMNAPEASGPPSNIRPTPPSGTVGVPYNHTFIADGEPPINWEFENLPPGLTSNGNIISGTPTMAGSYTVRATARNGHGQFSRNFTVVIARAPTPPPRIILPNEWTDDTVPQQTGGSQLQAHLPNAVIGTRYNQTLLTRGFENSPVPPLYWRVVGGTLPPGLHLTQWINLQNQPGNTVGADNRAGSVIEGIPTAAGAGKLYTFIAEASEIIYYGRRTGVLPVRDNQSTQTPPTPATNHHWESVWRAPGHEVDNVLNYLGTGTLPAGFEEIIWITDPVPAMPNVPAIPARTHRVIIRNGSHHRATRTINIYVRPDAFFEVTGLTLRADGMALRGAAPPAGSGLVGTDAVNNRLLINAGSSRTITPVIAPANATVRDVIYESSNPSAATIDNRGRITAHAAGTTLITVTTICGHWTDSVLVTVNVIPATRITLNVTALRVGVGGTATLTATVLPANASDKTVTWVSETPGVATVNSEGIVTGVAQGTAVITATVANPNTLGTAAIPAPARVTVTVDPLAVTGVGLKAETTLGVGATETLIPVIDPPNASNRNVTWTSSDISVATVSPGGVITGVAPGTATVTVTTADGGYTAGTTVKVINAFNISIGTALNGTVTIPQTRVMEGTKVTMSVSPNPGYYLVGWETSPVDVPIASNSFTMPAQNITVTPIFKQLKLLSDDFGHSLTNLDTNRPSFVFRYSASDVAAAPHNSIGRSMLASELAELARRNPAFTIDFETPFGIYHFPANIASIIPDMNGLLERNNVNANEIMFNVIMTDMSRDRAVIDAIDNYNMTRLGPAVDFTIEIAKINANGGPGNRIAVVENFTSQITRLIPFTRQPTPVELTRWGAFRYNAGANQFDFVPHTTRMIGNTLYAVIKSATNSVYVIAENAVTFSDVPDNRWYTDTVLKAASKNLVRGLGGGLFQPDRNVTRAEFVQMMVNALQLPSAASGTRAYGDVGQDKWHYNAIMRARSAGLLDKLSGSSGNFRPDQNITREEMAAIVAAILKSKGHASVSTGEISREFDDFSSINSTYREDVALAFSLGILRGKEYDGGRLRFGPSDTTTRAEAATVQIRLLEFFKDID